MKKKLLISSVLIITMVLMLGLLSVGSYAANNTLHKCPDGEFDPIIEVRTDRISIIGCNTCHNTLNYPSERCPSVYIDMTDGATFNVGNYTIPVKDFTFALLSLSGTENEPVVAYAGLYSGSSAITTQKPTKCGMYYAYLTTKKLFAYYQSTGSTQYKDGDTTISVFTSPTAFTLAHTCTAPYSVTYFADGGKLYAKCSCGFVFDETASLDTPSETQFCVAPSGDYFTVNDSNWKKGSLAEVIRLYEGRDGTDYSLSEKMPTEHGDYTVSLAVKSIWESTPDLVSGVRTTPIEFTIGDDLHVWDYEADGQSLKASCELCDETARVTLDASAVYETARHLSASGIKEELFYEENWSCHKTIKPYQVIFNGKEVDNTGTVEYEVSIVKPEGTGNYIAQLAIMEDPFDITTISVTSDPLPFYVAGYSLSRCQVVDYGPNEIARFEKPEVSGNTYYVGTLSELQWCVYHQTKDEMNIVLTNDIVVNPITVTEKGNVSSGAIFIYKWRGFGAYDPFTGSIDGQGHTIYGLYVPERTGVNGTYLEAGLINYGENCSIKNLTIESSYIKSHGAVSAFIGALALDENYCGVFDGHIFANCHSLHNLLISDNQAGGIVGWAWCESTTSSILNLRDCVNNSTVTAPIAGGIIGEVAEGIDGVRWGHIWSCRNYGKITGSQYAGGIVASLNVRWNVAYEIDGCLNAGYIASKNCEGGIVGCLAFEADTAYVSKGSDRVLLCKNVNTGTFGPDCANTACDILAMTAGENYYTDEVLELESNYYSRSYPYYLKLKDYFKAVTYSATSLTVSDIANGKVCEILGHVKDYHYSSVVPSTCTTDGSKKVVCLTCGKELSEYSVSIPAHGHYYQDGECVFCERESPKLLGASVFTNGSVIACSVIAVLLLCAAAVVIVIKKKKQAK